ncbi:MAG: hypothetical protein VW339_12795, partial [Quisquiliibacterium sp.]
MPMLKKHSPSQILGKMVCLARSLPFRDDYDIYEMQVRQELAQDSPRSTHSFASGGEWWGRRPGIVVPDG